MHNDRLDNLLRLASRGSAGPAPDPAALAHRVRLLDRRRRLRFGTAAAACVLLLTMGAWRWHKLELAAPRVADDAAIASHDAMETSPVLIDEIAIEAAERRIGQCEQIVARLLASERLARAESQLQSTSTWAANQEPAYESSELAAGAIMLAAEHKAHLPQLASSIEQDCRLIIDLFPGTAEAAQARRRLADTVAPYMP